MSNAVIEVIGLEDVLQRLGALASPAVLSKGMHQAVAIVQKAVAVYPPASRRAHGPWKSEKQRRYVMMLVSTGQVPYKRTTQLGKSWTTSVEGSGVDIIGRVGNNTSYGPYVMGSEGTQASYHVGTWPRAVEVATKHKDEVIACFVTVAQEALNG